MGALPSLVRHLEEETLYRIYAAECLNLTPQNKYLTKRYSDLIKPQKQDDRDPDEIAAEIIKKAGLTIG